MDTGSSGKGPSSRALTQRTRSRSSGWVLLALAVAAVAAMSLWRSTTDGDRSLAAAERHVAPVVEPEERAPDVLTAPEAAPERVELPTTRTEMVPAGDQAIARAKLASISGYVQLPSGFPRDAEVSVTAIIADGLAGEMPPCTSAEHGEFHLERVLAGNYVIRARAQSGERIATGWSDTVAAPRGADVRGITIMLDEYFVEGVVTDIRGIHQPDVKVRYRLEPIRHNRTDQELINLSSGWISSNDLKPTTSSIRRLQVFDNEAAPEARAYTELTNFVVSYDANVAAAAAAAARQTEVVDQPLTMATLQGQQIENLRISLGTELMINSGDKASWRVISTPSEPPFVLTDASGRYRIPIEGPHVVHLTAGVGPDPPEGQGWITVDQSVRVDRQNPIGRADFALTKSSSIGGDLGMPDGSDTRISVFLRRIDASNTTTGNTDQNGVFLFRGLAEGTYLFYARTGGESGQDFSLHREFHVAEGEHLRFDDFLMASSSARGVLVDGNGTPLAGRKVNAVGSRNSSLDRSATTDASGAFELRGMYACEYVLNVEGGELARPVVFKTPPQGGLVDLGVVALRKTAN